MKCRPTQLTSRLKEGAPELALVSGNEPLLVQEAVRAICTAAKNAGASEHMHKLLLNDNDLEQVLAETTTGSLFAQKRLCEVHCRFERNSQKIYTMLHTLVSAADAATRVVLVCDRLDKTSANGAWVKHIEQHGLWVEVWPLTEQEHAKWLEQRLAYLQLNIEDDGLQTLFELTVGNLISADQEIRKLALLHPKNHLLSREDILASTADNARFSMFSLVDYALIGKPERVVHSWRQLSYSGITPYEVAAQIGRTLNELLQLSQAVAVDREDRREVARRLRLLPAKIKVYEQAMERLKYQHIISLLRQANALDSLLKGLRQGDGYQAIQALLLAIAGKPSPALKLLATRQ